MINNLQTNEFLNQANFLVKKLDKKTTSTGKPFYEMILSDRTGEIVARIWENNFQNCEIKENVVISLEGKVQEYKNKKNIIINSCKVDLAKNIQSYIPCIPTLVFDLETVGKDFEELDPVEQDYLLNSLEKNTEDKEEAKTKTGLYSVFGSICAAGMYDPDLNKGTTIVISNKEIDPEKDNFTYIIVKDEKELIEKFWEISKEYTNFVTYNGINFDFPYLINRSIINRIKVPLNYQKYSHNFIDLMDKFKQNNRGFRLEILAKAMGIENPKEEGIHGGDVNILFKNKEYKQIADYVSRDAYSTYLLYQIYKDCTI